MDWIWIGLNNGFKESRSIPTDLANTAERLENNGIGRMKSKIWRAMNWMMRLTRRRNRGINKNNKRTQKEREIGGTN